MNAIAFSCTDATFNQELSQIVQNILALEYSLHVLAKDLLRLALFGNILQHLDSLLSHPIISQGRDNKLLEFLLGLVLDDYPCDQISSKHFGSFNKSRVLKYINEQELACLVSLWMSKRSIEEIESFLVDFLIGKDFLDHASHIVAN